MKQQILSLCAMLLLCALTQNTAFAQSEKKPMVGNDSDSHGCKRSTGATWSVLKEACIRVFEDGHRLDAKGKGISKTFSAFVVFRSTMNQAQAELFLPNSEGSILLDAKDSSNDNFWQNKKYILKRIKGVYSLYNKKKQLLYRGK